MQPYSVVIPAYNASETLAEALDSVLCQSVKPAEIIVVDDGSSDDTAAIAAGFGRRVQVVSQDNSGPGKATSNGFHHASSPLIATLDADDIWLENKLELQLEILTRQQEISLVFCKQRQFRHGRGDDGTGEVRPGLNRSGILVRRQVFDAVGDFRDQHGNIGDCIDWVARARDAGFQFAEIDQVLALRRIIKGSLSHRLNRDKNRGYLKVAHRAMLRRRQAASGE